MPTSAQHWLLCHPGLYLFEFELLCENQLGSDTMSNVLREKIELELTQTRMAQKPMLMEEAGALRDCACRRILEAKSALFE